MSLTFQVFTTVCCLAPGLLGAQALIINEVMASNDATIQDAQGESGDWIELRNTTDDELPLNGYYLTDDAEEPAKYPLPNRTLPPGGYLLVWADDTDTVNLIGEIHTNFRISSEGEAIYLYDANGVLLDQSPAEALHTDVSIGRARPGVRNWAFFAEPTPSAPNRTPTFSGISDRPVFSLPPGFYHDSIQLGVSTPGTVHTIRYTTDGAEPGDSSSVWAGPISIDSTTVVRARAFRQGFLPSEVVTRSFLFTDSLSLPVMSLAVPPEKFYGREGIYTQYWSGDEIALNAEYFTVDKQLAFNQGLGVKIHAPDSREQKSLRLYARGRYGGRSIDYPIFADTDVTEFRRLVLRNGGNDGAEERRLHLKDGYAHRLYKQLDPDYLAAAYQPVHTFINGEYRGIYNLRERQDEHYLRSYTGYGPGEVDFLEYDYQEPLQQKIVSGDWDQWNTLMNCLTGDTDLDSLTCDSIIATIDTVNFTDYQIFEIFIGNQDWLNNNIKFWKPRGHGQWKWVLWDTEYGLGTQARFPSGNPGFDFMRMALLWGGWGNGDHTWMLRNLIENRPGFRERFATRYSDLLNTIFLPEYLDAEFEAVVHGIERDLPLQLERYGNTQAQWDEHYLHTRDFILNRGRFARTNLAGQLMYNDTTQTLHLDVSNPAAGRIRLNTITIDERLWGWQAQPYPWRGEYFPDLPTTVTALPNEGYRFVGWGGDIVSADSTLRFTVDSTTALVAIFEPAQVDSVTGLLINEVVASNATTLPDAGGGYPDWIEVYNPGAEPMNLAGVYVTDDPEEPFKYQLPPTDSLATTVPAGGYLVLFADGNADEGALHLPFRLAKQGESVVLSLRATDGAAEVIDHVTFPALETDQSYGRLPNGGPEWRTLEVVTPGAANELPTSLAGAKVSKSVTVYPNPVSDVLTVNLANIAGPVTLEAYDGVGRLLVRRMAAGGAPARLDVRGLAAGKVTLVVKAHAGEVLRAGVVISR